MGLCNSCDASSPTATAKVILHDGRLQEHSHPVKVSAVVQSRSGFFLCNSDEMEFDDVVSAVDSDEELQPGQLYFVLPVSQLRRPLSPEEMAALAVKANNALTKSDSGERKLVFAEKDVKAIPAGKGTRNRNVESGRRRSKKKESTAKLSAIPE